MGNKQGGNGKFVLTKKTLGPFIREKIRRVLRATACKYGLNNGPSRKIDFAHILPIDWP